MTVQVSIDNATYTLDYNQNTGKYYKSITAPSASSNSLAVGFYPTTITATDIAGNTTTVGVSDSTWGDYCKLYVKENIRPVVENISPTSSSYCVTSTPGFEFTAKDDKNYIDTGYAGFNLNDANLYSISISKDNGSATTYTPANISSLFNNVSISGDSTTLNAGGGYGKFTFRGDFLSLSDGEYTISITVTDRDSNSSLVATTTFTVDTVAPSLTNIQINGTNVDGTLTINTNVNPITVAAVTNDTSATATITVEATGKTTQTATPTIGQNGAFSSSFTLDGDATYTVTIKVQDVHTLASTTNVTVILNTQAPIFDSIEFVPNPVTGGNEYIIYVQVH